MKLYCNYCGKDIIKSPREVKRNKHHFCNRDCYHKFRRIKQKIQPSPRDMSAQIKIKTLARKLALIKVRNG